MWRALENESKFASVPRLKTVTAKDRASRQTNVHVQVSRPGPVPALGQRIGIDRHQSSSSNGSAPLAGLVEQLLQLLGLEKHLEVSRAVRDGLLLPARQALAIAGRVLVVAGEL